MDFWGALTFFFFIFLLLSCCSYCCSSKRRGVILSTPVVVTSATHTAPGGYPVSQMPPSGGMPANVYAAPYQTGQHNMTATTMQMPMQQPPVGFQQPYQPYPPMGVPATVVNMNPPSYEAAVHGVGTGAGNAVPYEKQAPYNPNFSSQ